MAAPVSTSDSLQEASRKAGLREPFLAASHLFGAALSLLGIFILASNCEGASQQIVVIGIYGFSLVSLFLASGLLHGLHHSEKGEVLFERLDYSAIYLFIAGTYTPVCVFLLKDEWGTAILCAQWVMAAIGVFCTARWGFARKTVQIAVFLLMGWMFVLTFSQLASALPNLGFILLISGGLFYSVGALIFAFAPRTFLGGRIESHAVWHVFVLCGATAHYLMICNFMMVS